MRSESREAFYRDRLPRGHHSASQGGRCSHRRPQVDRRWKQESQEPSVSAIPYLGNPDADTSCGPASARTCSGCSLQSFIRYSWMPDCVP